MRVSLLLVAAGLLLTAFRASAEDSWKVGRELVVERLDSSVYVITDTDPYPANELLVEMADSSLVLINTPYTAETTADLLRWIAERFGQRKIIEVNGHFHNDCLGGNAALKKAGIPIYGSDLTATMLARLGEARKQQMIEWLKDDPAKQNIFRSQIDVPPDHLFPLDSGLVLTFGADSLVLYYPGPAHSIDNIVAWFPSQGVLFGGCMILAGDRVGNTSDADLKEWPKSVAKLRRFKARYLVPGHGHSYSPDLLDHTLEILRK